MRNSELRSKLRILSYCIPFFSNFSESYFLKFFSIT